MFSKILQVPLAILIFLAADSSAGGKPQERHADNQTMPWYAITCFSLKQGSSLRNARFRLHENGKLEFVIQGETLRGTKANYAYDGIRFNAAVDFFLHKGRHYRYGLSLTGLRILEAYAGLARLREYIEETKLTQEVVFLFIAFKESENKPERTIPFL